MRLSFITLLAGMTGLGGCANTHWERAFYEGARAGQPACARDRTGVGGAPAASGPCQPLPSHDAYERERQGARGKGAP